MQADFQKRESAKAAANLNSSPATRHPDLSLQIPPRNGVGSGNRSKSLVQSPGVSNGSPTGGGFFRGLSFKRKIAGGSDGERSSLLRPDSKMAPDSPSFSSWKRCTSLPVTPASNGSPTVPTPTSARTVGERQKSHVINLSLCYSIWNLTSKYFYMNFWLVKIHNICSEKSFIRFLYLNSLAV